MIHAHSRQYGKLWSGQCKNKRTKVLLSLPHLIIGKNSLFFSWFLLKWMLGIKKTCIDFCRRSLKFHRKWWPWTFAQFSSEIYFFLILTHVSCWRTKKINSVVGLSVEEISYLTIQVFSILINPIVLDLIFYFMLKAVLSIWN